MTKAKKNVLVMVGVIILLIGFFVFLKPQNKEIYGLSAGTYSVVGSDALFQPNIHFDLQKNRFIFTYDLLSSYANAGKIEIGNGRVIASTDDNKYIFVFEVVDNDTIRFVQDGSAKIHVRPGNTAIVDGTEFNYADER